MARPVYTPHALISSRWLFWIAAAFALVMLAPVLWLIGLALKNGRDLTGGTLAVFGGPYALDNFADIFKSGPLPVWFFNSLVVATGQTLGVLVLSSLAGYAFARLEFPFRRTLFVIVLVGLVVPEPALIVARHQMFGWAGLHNTHLGLMLPGMSSAFGVLVMTQFFKSLPRELDEAALLDNTSRFRIFSKVLLPLTLPAQAALGSFTFLLAWNDYWWPLISATKDRMYTLTVGIASVQYDIARPEGLGLVAAQALCAAIPAIVVYLLFRRQIVVATLKSVMR